MYGAAGLIRDRRDRQKLLHHLQTHPTPPTGSSAGAASLPSSTGSTAAALPSVVLPPRAVAGSPALTPPSRLKNHQNSVHLKH